MKIILLIISVFYTSLSYGYMVCGPAIPENATTGYTTTIESYVPAKWAVGTNCIGKTTDADVTKMCDVVYVAGEAYIAGEGYNPVFDHTVRPKQGYFCWCRRTHVRKNGELVENIGQWLVGSLHESTCSQNCAEHVATDAGGLRNAIMLLPSLI